MRRPCRACMARETRPARAAFPVPGKPRAKCNEGHAGLPQVSAVCSTA